MCTKLIHSTPEQYQYGTYHPNMLSYTSMPIFYCVAIVAIRAMQLTNGGQINYPTNATLVIISKFFLFFLTLQTT